MRRADREVNDFNEILGIMRGCDSLFLSLMDGEYPYVIPMNFGFEEENGKVRIYLHGAKDGKKLELIAKDDHVAFAMSRAHNLIPGNVPCATSFQYESVCGRGKISMVQGEEACHALSVIVAQYDHEQVHTFDERHVKAVSVMRIDVEQLTGKRRTRK